MSKVVFDRFDLWVTYKDGGRELLRNFKDKDLLKKYINSKSFKKILKKTSLVEVLQVFEKVEGQIIK